jgi:hypothetical protein
VIWEMLKEKKRYPSNWAWYLILAVEHRKCAYASQHEHRHQCMVVWKIFLKEEEIRRKADKNMNTKYWSWFNSALSSRILKWSHVLSRQQSYNKSKLYSIFCWAFHGCRFLLWQNKSKENNCIVLWCEY